MDEPKKKWQVVTTNHEKSAEAIVPKVTLAPMGRAEL